MLFTLIQTIAADPVVGMLRTYVTILLVGALLLLFKPLLLGIVNAIIVAIRPRLTKEERIARRKMRDSMMLQQMINASTGPSDMAELRAMGCRS